MGGRTEAAAEHAHDGALLHHSQVGEQSQLQPSSHGEAAHSCDQRLGQLQAGRTLEETCAIKIEYKKKKGAKLHAVHSLKSAGNARFRTKNPLEHT